MDNGCLVVEQRRPPYLLAIVAGIAALVLFFVAAWLSSGWIDDTEGGKAALLRALVAVIGTTPLRLWVLFQGMWCAAKATCAIWQICDPRPHMIIDATGVTFHPSVHCGQIPWSDIAASRLTTKKSWKPVDDYGGRELQLDLVRTYWSIDSLWPRRRISLAEASVARTGGLKDAAKLIRFHRLAAGWTR